MEENKQEKIKKYVQNLPYHCTADSIAMSMISYLEEKGIIKFKKGQKRTLPLRPFLTKNIDEDIKSCVLQDDFLKYYKQQCEFINKDACEWTRPEILKKNTKDARCMTGQEMAIIFRIPRVLMSLLDGQE